MQSDLPSGKRISRASWITLALILIGAGAFFVVRGSTFRKALKSSGSPATFIGDPPNIIFIMVDNMGYGDAGCYGSKAIKTPNLDRMAAEGMRFTQAYSGAPICAPSRSTLMTGMHGGHTSVRGNGGGVFPCYRMT